ncbi:MAG TPA: hypothetical protein ENH87_07570 [Pricia antarctica]|jgi:hypothetical protein|uniref:Uncharacterized protein n=1 Tax=Pricia antarctica TaxID=641691 RepID=A0A831VNB9_9FLAO|nr:hypothetical protein [Pricia antarctica]
MKTELNLWRLQKGEGKIFSKTIRMEEYFRRNIKRWHNKRNYIDIYNIYVTTATKAKIDAYRLFGII